MYDLIWMSRSFLLLQLHGCGVKRLTPEWKGSDLDSYVWVFFHSLSSCICIIHSHLFLGFIIWERGILVIFFLCTRKLHPKPLICGLNIKKMLGNCQALKQKSSLKNFITDMGMNTRILRYCGQCGDIVGKGYWFRQILLRRKMP